MNSMATMLALVAVAAVIDADGAGNQAESYVPKLGQLINEYRVQQGLPPLALDAPLSELAHEHARTMAHDNRLSHDGFQQRFAKAQSPTCVENVGSNFDKPEAEFDAWRNSPAHDHNLLDSRITRMGIATEDRYVAFFACR